MNITSILLVVEIILSALLVLSIVLQPKDGDTGTLFGGGFGDEVKRTKRGFELFLHNSTIFIGVLWVSVAIAMMFVSN
jgi:protein translocase SecG subunit